jgi:hypothetical protein
MAEIVQVIGIADPAAQEHPGDAPSDAPSDAESCCSGGGRGRGSTSAEPDTPAAAVHGHPGEGGRTREPLSELSDPEPLAADMVERMREAASEQLPMSTDAFFDTFLANTSNWDDEFHAERGDTELVVSAWRKQGAGTAP